MAKKSTKKTLKPVRPQLGDGVEILNAGSVLEDPITRTLETNYMPYAMSVIVSGSFGETIAYPGFNWNVNSTASTSRCLSKVRRIVRLPSSMTAEMEVRPPSAAVTRAKGLFANTPSNPESSPQAGINAT